MTINHSLALVSMFAVGAALIHLPIKEAPKLRPKSLGLIASGFINVAAVAGGAWFGSLTWPWSTAAALQRRSSI